MVIICGYRSRLVVKAPDSSSNLKDQWTVFALLNSAHKSASQCHNQSCWTSKSTAVQLGSFDCLTTFIALSPFTWTYLSLCFYFHGPKVFLLHLHSDLLILESKCDWFVCRSSNNLRHKTCFRLLQRSAILATLSQDLNFASAWVPMAWILKHVMFSNASRILEYSRIIITTASLIGQAKSPSSLFAKAMISCGFTAPIAKRMMALYFWRASQEMMFLTAE